ncbi:methylamine utilization protein [Pseudoalteromonas sp. NBT06-2]|uniref:plastocyanin/azurin family copper-binding protein n=1 Tax=Pseudoalteromonas sp. NBT06-2 TaxID=2025950 RepID=UPI000BA64AE8|nr:plastocyanin/azurin family copper-binding protein [Pseudoalteromonas sp. NBT06-2]PAJ71827.1 methylamine utilization protein [Pseudoalteromonas sp. NBT06-2]
MKTILSIACSITIMLSYLCVAETHEIGQKNKDFTKKVLTIKKGDIVKFKNLDPFFHNVFSLSDVKFFDLGSFPQGDFKEIVFEETGEVGVECAIHPNMIMTIKVEE